MEKETANAMEMATKENEKRKTKTFESLNF